MVSMNTTKSQINLRNVSAGNDTVMDEFELEICYQYEIVGNSKMDHEYDFETTLSLDTQSSVIRATTDSDLKLLRFSTKKQCIRKKITVNTSFYYVDIPIVFGLTYKLINQKTTGEQFCDSCAILEKTPNTINFVKHSVVFGKECDNDDCRVDMKLFGELRNFNTSLVVNGTKSLELMYKITNMGDVAYATKLNVNFSQNVKILKMNGYCESTDVIMTCSINNGRALRNNTVIVVNVTLDGSTLMGDQLVITAQLSSSGKEIEDADNRHTHAIELKRFSEVDVRGLYNPSYFDIDKQDGTSVIKSKLIVENLGPSNIQNTTVSVLIPETFDNGARSCPLIEAVKSVKILNGEQEFTFSSSPTTHSSTSQSNLKPFNESTHSNLDFLRNKQEVILSCHQAYVRCRNVTFFIADFIPSPQIPLQIELELDVQPKALLKLFPDEDNTLVSLFVTVDFVHAQTEIHQSTQGSIVFYRTGSGVPMWVYVLSVLLGALILAVITHLLHKRQFFKRMTQSDMEEKLTRENSKKVAYTDGSVMMICDSTANILA
uniref:Integrin alpha-PS3 n=1 Tax=Culex pipiens TaxID=7175 RepID=A0A8D8A0H2_CULPI